jgi:hypothetical protein
VKLVNHILPHFALRQKYALKETGKLNPENDCLPVAALSKNKSCHK